MKKAITIITGIIACAALSACVSSPVSSDEKVSAEEANANLAQECAVEIAGEGVGETPLPIENAQPEMTEETVTSVYENTNSKSEISYSALNGVAGQVPSESARRSMVDGCTIEYVYDKTGKLTEEIITYPEVHTADEFQIDGKWYVDGVPGFGRVEVGGPGKVTILHDMYMNGHKVGYFNGESGGDENALSVPTVEPEQIYYSTDECEKYENGIPPMPTSSIKEQLPIDLEPAILAE